MSQTVCVWVQNHESLHIPLDRLVLIGLHISNSTWNIICEKDSYISDSARDTVVEVAQ